MNSQRGFTILEVLIAGAIGIFVLTGLVNLFFTTTKTISLSDSMSTNQETGRVAMNYISRFVRKAGYTLSVTQDIPPIFISSLDIDCEDETTSEACASNNPNDTPILGDQLSIFLEVGNTPDEEIRSCTGQSVGGPANGAQSIAMVFWVSDEPGTRRELRCRTFDYNLNDWLDDPVSIIGNVELFEFQLGIATDPTEPQASQYVSLDTLEADLNLTVNNIRSIRIAILTTSLDSNHESRKNTLNKERKYGLLDAPTLTIEDANLRNIFINTIELPNMIGKVQAG